MVEIRPLLRDRHELAKPVPLIRRIAIHYLPRLFHVERMLKSAFQYVDELPGTRGTAANRKFEAVPVVAEMPPRSSGRSYAILLSSLFGDTMMTLPVRETILD